MYPLLGTKRLDYMDWKIILGYFTDNKQWVHKDDIVKLKAQMNDNRKTFTWDHLAN